MFIIRIYIFFNYFFCIYSVYLIHKAFVSSNITTQTSFTIWIQLIITIKQIGTWIERDKLFCVLYLVKVLILTTEPGWKIICHYYCYYYWKFMLWNLLAAKSLHSENSHRRFLLAKNLLWWNLPLRISGGEIESRPLKSALVASHFKIPYC